MSAEEKELRELERQIKAEHGDQGRMAVDEATAKNRTYYGRVMALYALQSRLVNGERLYGTARQMLGDEAYEEFRKEWRAAEARANGKFKMQIDGVRPVGQAIGQVHMTRPPKPQPKPGEKDSGWEGMGPGGRTLQGDGSNLGDDDDIPF